MGDRLACDSVRDYVQVRYTSRCTDVISFLLYFVIKSSLKLKGRANSPFEVDDMPIIETRAVLVAVFFCSISGLINGITSVCISFVLKVNILRRTAGTTDGLGRRPAFLAD